MPSLRRSGTSRMEGESPAAPTRHSQRSYGEMMLIYLIVDFDWGA